MKRGLLLIAALAAITSACSEGGEHASNRTTTEAESTSSTVSSSATGVTTSLDADPAPTPLDCEQAAPEPWPGEDSPHLIAPVVAGATLDSVDGLSEALDSFGVPFSPRDSLSPSPAPCSFYFGTDAPVFLNLSRATGDEYWISGIAYPLEEPQWGITVQGPVVNVSVASGFCAADPTCSASASVRYGDSAASSSTSVVGPGGTALTLEVDREPAQSGRIMIRGTASDGRTVALVGKPLPPGDFGAG